MTNFFFLEVQTIQLKCGIYKVTCKVKWSEHFMVIILNTVRYITIIKYFRYIIYGGYDKKFINNMEYV